MNVLGQIAADPGLAYYYGQKAIRHPALRHKLGGLVAAMRSVRPGAASSSDGRVVDELNEDGISFLPDLHLDRDTLASIHAMLDDKPLVDWYTGQQVGSINDDIPNSYVKLSQQPENVAACEPLIRLANHPAVLSAVTSILGAAPVISAYQVWWTLGEHQAFGPTHHDDVYHRDVDDLRFLKLFCYLTDAKPSNGAHCYVRGSHRSPLYCRRGPISDEAIEKNFPAEDILVVTGDGGTVFLENTWGIHRPLLATEGRRMIFSAIYTLTPWLPGRPKKPFLPIPAGLNPTINRVYFKA